MAFEVVKQILEIENQGEDLVKKARIQAQDTQNSAKDEAEVILQNARKEAEEYYNGVISKYEAEAMEAIAPLNEEGRVLREKIANIPQSLLDKAVNVVIERIVNNHG